MTYDESLKKFLAMFDRFTPRKQSRLAKHAGLIARVEDSMQQVADRYRAMILRRGARLFNIEGKIILALNERNAQRKYRNLVVTS